MKTSSHLATRLCAAVFLTAAHAVFAQAPAPAAAPPAPAPGAPSRSVSNAEPEGAQGVKEGLIQFEVFSLPPLSARKALIAHPKESELYQWLDAALDKKDSAAVLEHAHTLRVRGGRRSKVESIQEYAYATEMDPPQIPQNISVAAPAGDAPQSTGDGRIFAPWPCTSTTPNSFTFRNLGWTVEAELTFSEDGKVADMNLAPQLVRIVALVPQGLNGEVTQPVFETQKSTGSLAAWVGQPTLVSSFSPPIGTGAPGGNKVDRVWLLFVTVTFPQ